MSLSPYWGEAGELWDPTGPLKDWSRVGYHGGDDPLPSGRGPITFGPGRHVFTDVIRLRSKQILRGAGRDLTTLVFPKSLVGMGYPCPGENCWDWWGGVIEAVDAIEVGIEDLTIEFPDHSWKHHNGQGFNGPNFQQCRDCWIRNVRVVNYDVGLRWHGSERCTALDVVLTRNPGGAHIDCNVTGGSQILVEGVQLTGSSAYHGLAGNWGADWAVFANVSGASGVTLDPNHNGPDSTHFLYSNVQSGTDRIRQTSAGPNGFRWNVGNRTFDPRELHAAQVAYRKLRPFATLEVT